MVTPSEKLINKMMELDEFFYEEIFELADELIKNPTPTNYERFNLAMKADHHTDCFLEKWKKGAATVPGAAR